MILFQTEPKRTVISNDSYTLWMAVPFALYALFTICQRTSSQNAVRPTMARLLSYMAMMMMIGTVHCQNTDWVLHSDTVLPRGSQNMAIGHYDGTVYLLYVFQIVLCLYCLPWL